jgi:arsenate reductase-like glutaredoxin family protein
MSKEHVDAKKDRIGPDEALILARKVKTLIVARGKKVVRFEMAKDRPDDETLLAHLIGPSGNLRAPTLIVGKTLIVGFNPEMYREELNG